MTKPRPDQPGRCPSIDPHDTLQCTRAIHDDDQCSAGGIAWRKGSPRIEWDRERADRLQKEVEEYDATLTRQGDLLTRTVNALRGNPPPLTSWSHHDIPELAAEKVSEVERLTAELAEVKRTYTPCDLDLLTERDALAAKVAQVEALAEEWEREADDLLRNCYSGRDVFEAERTMQMVSELRAVLAGSEADTSGREE